MPATVWNEFFAAKRKEGLTMAEVAKEWDKHKKQNNIKVETPPRNRTKVTKEDKKAKLMEPIDAYERRKAEYLKSKSLDTQETKDKEISKKDKKSITKFKETYEEKQAQLPRQKKQVQQESSSDVDEPTVVQPPRPSVAKTSKTKKLLAMVRTMADALESDSE